MANLNQAEFNSIREITLAHQTMACKLENYANQCQDPQIKQMFTQASESAKQSAQKLTQML